MALLTIVTIPLGYLGARGQSYPLPVESNDSAEIIHNYLEDEIIDLFPAEELKSVKRRLDTPDDDLRIVRFLLNDGTEEMRIFNDPIKYVSCDGKVHTKSTIIYETPDSDIYRFSNRDNDVLVKFGADYSKGVFTEFKDHEVSIYPVNNSKAVATINEKSDTVRYESVFSESSHVEYRAQYSGIKEDIVLDQYEGITEFSFVVMSSDRIEEENGTIQVLDKDNVCIGSFGSIYISDAAGNHIYGEANVEQIEETKYLYTVSVPEQYLTDPKTVYPVIVDPSFTFNFYAYNFAGYKQIYDVTLSQSGYYYAPDDSNLYVCHIFGIGLEVALIKMPNLRSILNKIGASNINSVGFSYFSFTDSTNSVTVMPMSVNWKHTATSLSNDEYIDLFNGYYPNGHIYGSLQYSRGTLDITSIAQGWLDNTYSNYGIMITGMNYTNLASAEIANGNYRPYIKINYNYQNTAGSVDPFVGLKRLIPYKSNGLISDYAMKNANNVVMTQITDNVYASDQLLLVSATPYGYTIQNPYNDYYLTSDYDDVIFSAAPTSSSYWSFVNTGVGYYIVGTSQEQLDCLLPGSLGANVRACLSYQGTNNKQPTTWHLSRHIDKIPFKLKNAFSGKYLTTANALDYDVYGGDSKVNIFQHTLYTTVQNTKYNPVFGIQGVRPVKEPGTTKNKLHLMSSKNGRFRVLSWDSSGNAFQYNPSSNSNTLSISVNSDTGYAVIKQSTGSKLALSVTDNNQGSETGMSSNSQGNIVFSTYNKQDEKQKWVLVVDMVQFKKEAYYSQFSIVSPLPNNSYNKHINSDYGPRILSGSENIHDGIDLRANTNTPVYATITGEVVAVVSSINAPNVTPTSRGLYVLIKSNSANTVYNYGTNTPLCMLAQHLNSVNVSLGQTVSAGQLIGYTGGSGLTMNSYSPHFHYAYCTEDAFSTNEACKFVDPLLFHREEMLYETINGMNYYLIDLE